MALKIMTPKDFNSDPIEDGMYESVVSEISEGKKFNNFKQQEVDVLQIKFKIVDKGEYKDRTVSQTFSPVMTKNSNLMGLWRSLFGHDATVEEMAAIDTTADLAKMILDKPVQVIIKNKESKKEPGRMFYNISDFMKSKRKVAATPKPSKKPEDMTDDELKSFASEIGLEA